MNKIIKKMVAGTISLAMLLSGLGTLAFAADPLTIEDVKEESGTLTAVTLSGTADKAAKGIVAVYEDGVLEGISLTSDIAPGVQSGDVNLTAPLTYNAQENTYKAMVWEVRDGVLIPIPITNVKNSPSASQEYTITWKIGQTTLTDKLQPGAQITPPTTGFTLEPGKAIKSWYAEGDADKTPVEFGTASADAVYVADIVNEYTITFRTDGNGTIASGSETAKVLEGEKVTFPEVTPNEHYTFEKWVLSSQSAGTPIDPDNVVATADATYQAIFQGEELTITFDYQDEGATANTTKTVRYGEVLAEYPADPTREGYNFDAWYTAATGGEAVDKTQKTFTENTTLYARWIDTSAPTHTITFGSDENGSIAAEDQSKEAQEGARVPFPTSTPNEGYEFVKWVLVTGESEQDVANPQAETVTADATYKAIHQKKTYTITFESDENGAVAEENKTLTVAHGDKVVFPATTPNEGYELAKWIVKDDPEKTAVDTDNTTAAANVTYQAVHEIIQYTVTFEYEDGTTAAVQKKVLPNTVLAEYPADPTKAGFIFVGWATAQTGGVPIDEATYSFTGDTTLYAQWLAEGTTVNVTVNNKVGNTVLETYSDTAQAGEVYQAKLAQTGYKLKDGIYYVMKQDAKTSIHAYAAAVTLDIEFEAMADSDKVLEYEDFNNTTDVWGFVYGKSASGQKSVKVEDGVLKLTDVNSTGYSDRKIFTNGVEDAKKLNISFDWTSRTEGGNSRSSRFDLEDADKNPIFSIYAQGGEGAYYAINKVCVIDKENPDKSGIKFGDAWKKEATCPWYTINLTLDFEAKTISGTITGGTEPVTIPSTSINATGLGQLAAYDVYSAAPQQIDNIKIAADKAVHTVTWKVEGTTLTKKFAEGAPMVPPTSGYTLAADKGIKNWYAEGDDSKTPVDLSAMGANDAVYVANVVDAYTITFTSDENGTIAEGSETAKVADGNKVTFPQMTANENYELKHWVSVGTGAEGADEIVADPNAVTATANVTYKAIHQGQEKTVTFKYQDGATADATKTVRYNEVLSEYPADPTRDGYNFIGWSLEASGAVIAKDSYVFTGDTTLYAQWVDASATTYTVTFQDGETPLGSALVVENEKVKADEIPTVADTDTKYFKGWTSDDGVTVKTAAEIAQIAVTGNITYTAVWGNLYTVTYDIGIGGTTTQETLTEKVKENDKPAAVPAITANAGYELAGWISSLDAEKTEIAPADMANQTITADVTYTASYCVPETGTIIGTPLFGTLKNGKIYRETFDGYDKSVWTGDSARMTTGTEVSGTATNGNIANPTAPQGDFPNPIVGNALDFKGNTDRTYKASNMLNVPYTAGQVKFSMDYFNRVGTPKNGAGGGSRIALVDSDGKEVFVFSQAEDFFATSNFDCIYVDGVAQYNLKTITQNWPAKLTECTIDLDKGTVTFNLEHGYRDNGTSFGKKSSGQKVVSGLTIKDIAGITWETTRPKAEKSAIDNVFLYNVVPQGRKAVTITATTDGTVPMEEAKVTIGTQTIETNAEGKAVFYREAGNYDYTVSKVGYENATGTITVADADVTETVTMTPAVIKEYTFTAKNEAGDAVSPITVEVKLGDDIVTPKEGAVYELAEGATYTYTVTNEGYDPMTGSITIAADTSQSIEVTLPELTYTLKFTTLPFATVKLNAGTSTSGKEVKEETVVADEAGEATLTTNVPVGSYTYDVTTDNTYCANITGAALAVPGEGVVTDKTVTTSAVPAYKDTTMLYANNFAYPDDSSIDYTPWTSTWTNKGTNKDWGMLKVKEERMLTLPKVSSYAILAPGTQGATSSATLTVSETMATASFDLGYGDFTNNGSSNRGSNRVQVKLGDDVIVEYNKAKVTTEAEVKATVGEAELGDIYNKWIHVNVSVSGLVATVTLTPYNSDNVTLNTDGAVTGTVNLTEGNTLTQLKFETFKDAVVGYQGWGAIAFDNLEIKKAATPVE